MAPVPEDQAPPSIGVQLAQALRENRVSQRALAKKLAAADKTQSESKRRWIQKLLNDEVDQPDMGEIIDALELPRDYFRLPSPAQVQSRRVRLEELAAEVARDREAQLSFSEEVLARLAALEGAQAHEAQQSTPQEKPGEGKAS